MAKTTTMGRAVTKKEFIRGSMWMYATAVVVFAAGLLTTVFLARLLDAELYGIFSVCVAVASLLSTFCDIGLNESTKYFSSFHLAKGESKKLSSYISILLKYKVFLIIVMCIIMYIFSGSFAQIFHSPQSVKYFEIAVLFLAFSSLFGFLLSTISGLRQFRNAALSNMFFNLLKLIIAPTLVFYGFGVTGALLGFVLAAGLTSFGIIYLLRGYITFRPSKIDLKDAFSYSFYAGVSRVSGMILAWTDSIMIGLFLLPVFVGYYRIALTPSWAVSGLVSAGMRDVLMPSLVSIEALGDRKRVQRYFNEAIKYASFISIPSVFGLALISRPLIALLFGQQYISAAPLLMVLSYFCFGSFMLVILISLFSALKRPKMIAQVFIIMAILNVIFNALLIPVYGTIGAATATVTTWILGLIIATILLKKKFDISFDISHLFKPLIASIIMFLLLYPLLPYVENIPVGVLFIAAAVLIYFGIMHIMGFPVKEVFAKIKSALGK